MSRPAEPSERPPASGLAARVEALGRWPGILVPLLLAYATALANGLAYDDRVVSRPTPGSRPATSARS